ncbi:MAG TPA: ankyrin repeat domain-containing protein [Candidatus Thermoplasmatota archaeon]|nr:ankyrin repeat domain-containing protein [Candidatus Thermoplasmatota archaeon]
MPADPDAKLLALMRAIAAGESATALGQLQQDPALATLSIQTGATRGGPEGYFLAEIGHYAYAGATALHIAAAAHRVEVVDALLRLGADVRRRDRRGAQPLHAASVGRPGAGNWDPPAQVATIVRLIRAGADPNSSDKNGATPLHRAARTRAAAAVDALLAGGADPARKNRSGSTPAMLAAQTTGRSGSGSPAAKQQQREIVRSLGDPQASTHDRAI